MCIVFIWKNYFHFPFKFEFIFLNLCIELSGYVFNLIKCMMHANWNFSFFVSFEYSSADQWEKEKRCNYLHRDFFRTGLIWHYWTTANTTRNKIFRSLLTHTHTHKPFIVVIIAQFSFCGFCSFIIPEMATAQVNRRRTALAEIPVRMSQLRVSTDEVPVLLNRTVIDSPLDNIPLGYLTPNTSQDECKFVLRNHLVVWLIFSFLRLFVCLSDNSSARPSSFDYLVTR